MNIDKRIESLDKLGKLLRDYTNSSDNYNNAIYDELNKAINKSFHLNGWFTKESILIAIENVSKWLTKENLNHWISNYKLKNTESKRVCVIMAGNIPLVGFHDFLSVLITGNIFIGKISSKDSILLPAIANLLIEIDSDFKNLILFTEGKLPEFDSIIATGSNNSTRYFEYYFSKYQHIIRHDRSSIAVITGDESKSELEELGKDIFLYYGLGCRNVSKIYFPKNYDFSVFFNAIEKYSDIFQHKKYMNNYTYYKAIYSMNLIKFYDNGFVLLTENAEIKTPVAVLNFEYYDNISDINSFIDLNNDKLQCIASNNSKVKNSIKFGEAQSPKLNDYADNVDTIDFLLGL